MKIRHILTFLFLATLSVVSVAQNEMPLPPQTGTFTGLTRGYFFTAPVDFTITEVGVPTDASSASQSVVIVTLPANPPAFPGNTLAYTTEFLDQNVAGPAIIPVSIPITAGTVVGVLGSRGTNSTNSYGTPSPWNTTLLGEPVTLARFLMQADLQFNWPFAVSTENGTFPIGRVNLTVNGGGPGAGSQCTPDPTGCVTVTCPPDATVACIDDVDLDPTLATAGSTCGAIVGQWVSNAYISGVPGCPGTTYTYIYRAVDSEGNIGCCERVITIDNTPAVVTVPPGGNVDCFEDISVDVSDATVTNDCAAFNVYLTAPEVVGEFGCPGTQYVFTYRMIDECGRTVEATRTFTVNNNAAPVVVAPDDVTCECLAGINPNPDYAEVTLSCGIESEVTVTGPQIFGTVDCPGTQYRYTYTVTDACGRTATDIQTFTVNNGPPVIDNDYEDDNWLQFNCEDYGGEDGTIAAIEAFIASVTAKTSCGVGLTVINNFNSNNINTCINNGINSITFRATDNCGRTSFSTTTYVVVDTEAPMIVEEAQDHWEMCNYNTQDNLDAWVANLGGAMAVDGCSNDNVSWQASPANPQINCVGAMGTTTVEVTFIVTDNCGNKTETTATFNALMAPGDLVGEDENAAAEALGTSLLQNRPNPFKDETTISFNLQESTFATLTIYDMNGRVLRVVEGNYAAGYNEVPVSGSDLGTTGVLYYQLRTNNETITKTMLVID